MDILKIYQYAMQRELEGKRFFEQNAITGFIDSSTLVSMVPDLPERRMAYLIERDFSEFYEKAAEKAEGENKKALKMLAEWEREHERLFKQYHDTAFEDYSRIPWGG